MKKRSYFSRLLLIVGVAVLFISIQGCKDSNSSSILWEVHSATQGESFQGKQAFSFFHPETGEELKTIQEVFREAPDKVVLKQIETVGGMEKTKIRFSQSSVDEKVDLLNETPFSPNLFLTPERKSFVTFPDVEFLLENYTVLLRGSGNPIAGRETISFELCPRREGRSTYLFCVDAEKKIILQYEERDAQGTNVLGYRYESIEFAPTFTEEIEIFMNTDNWEIDSSPAEGETEDLDFPYYLPPESPEGYQVLDSKVLGKESEKCLVITLTDGIENIYIFEYANRLQETWETLFAGKPERQGGKSGPTLVSRQDNQFYPTASLSLLAEGTVVHITHASSDTHELKEILDWILLSPAREK